MMSDEGCDGFCAEAIEDMNVCYILDGILIVYGLILTVLYCRLKMGPANESPKKQPAEGIYAGLNTPCNDTYETIGMQKKPVV
nr:PREDICTED: high affinity immunoglobulin epsilon receptor subunit gamma-like [Paralichthys olivaceus]